MNRQDLLYNNVRLYLFHLKGCIHYEMAIYTSFGGTVHNNSAFSQNRRAFKSIQTKVVFTNLE